MQAKVNVICPIKCLLLVTNYVLLAVFSKSICPQVRNDADISDYIKRHWVVSRSQGEQLVKNTQPQCTKVVSTTGKQVKKYIWPRILSNSILSKTTQHLPVNLMMAVGERGRSRGNPIFPIPILASLTFILGKSGKSELIYFGTGGSKKLLR
jgi:hypothetical protein